MRTAVVLICVAFHSIAAADDPVCVRVDKLISDYATKHNIPTGHRCDDATFLRRVHLDFAGIIPTPDRVREFLADTDPDKRTKLIDELLNAPTYAKRMATAFNVILMERQPENEEWHAYLEQSFAENKPWNQLALEILSPDPRSESTRASAYFHTRRLTKSGQQPTDWPGLTRDVGRLFLGVDLECAQCHRHRSVRDYKQIDFQGMFTVYKNVNIFRNTKFPAVTQKPMNTQLTFQSVFRDEKEMTGPRVPFADEIEVVSYKRGEEWEIVEDRKSELPGVLKFNPMRLLAERMIDPTNRRFPRNIANRIWFQLMGRGIVHPLDLHHSQNPPTHPELLEMLTDEIIAHDFDIKWLMRELALSETYQRSSRLPEGATKVPEESFQVALERPMSAEQVFWSVLRATRNLKRLVAESEKPDEEAEETESTDEEEPVTLESVKEAFLTAIANPPKEPEIDFAPTMKLALFTLNDDSRLGLLNPVAGNLVAELAKADDAADIIDQLYLSILSRSPDDGEREMLVEHFERHGTTDKTVALAAWALIGATEFWLVH